MDEYSGNATRPCVLQSPKHKRPATERVRSGGIQNASSWRGCSRFDLLSICSIYSKMVHRIAGFTFSIQNFAARGGRGSEDRVICKCIYSKVKLLFFPGRQTACRELKRREIGYLPFDLIIALCFAPRLFSSLFLMYSIHNSRLFPLGGSGIEE